MRFTLVELIVVLVILAILAAILVPALLGWIDKAKEKQIVLNARSAYMAAQSKASEEYAGADATTTLDGALSASDKTDILTIADVGNACTSLKIGASGAANLHDKFTIKFVVYEEAGYICVMQADKTWDTTKKADVDDTSAAYTGANITIK